MPYVNIKITRRQRNAGAEKTAYRRSNGASAPRTEQKHRHHGCGYRRS